VEFGISLINTVFEEYAQYFEATRQGLVCRYPASGYSIWPQKLRNQACKALRYSSKDSKTRIALAHDPDVYDLKNLAATDLAADRRLILSGWRFRNDTLFAKHSEIIRRYFRPVERWEKVIGSVIANIRPGCDVLIGVHIRQGDYASFLDGRYYYTTSQYATLLRKVRSVFGANNIRFVICSNAKQDKDELGDLDAVFGYGHELVDLYTLSECDYLIAAPSTYAMWASFYNETPIYIIDHIDRAPEISDFVVRSYCTEDEDRYFYPRTDHGPVTKQEAN